MNEWDFKCLNCGAEIDHICEEGKTMYDYIGENLMCPECGQVHTIMYDEFISDDYENCDEIFFLKSWQQSQK